MVHYGHMVNASEKRHQEHSDSSAKLAGLTGIARLLGRAAARELMANQPCSISHSPNPETQEQDDDFETSKTL